MTFSSNFTTLIVYIEKNFSALRTEDRPPPSSDDLEIAINSQERGSPNKATLTPH